MAYQEAANLFLFSGPPSDGAVAPCLLAGYRSLGQPKNASTWNTDCSHCIVCRLVYFALGPASNMGLLNLDSLACPSCKGSARDRTQQPELNRRATGLCSASTP
jgi:hypothetical protein